jgi:hypothetical protein
MIRSDRMTKQNRLLVPGCEEMINQYREEIAEEFGVYHPAASRDAMTSRLLRQEAKPSDDQGDC